MVSMFPENRRADSTIKIKLDDIWSSLYRSPRKSLPWSAAQSGVSFGLYSHSNHSSEIANTTQLLLGASLILMVVVGFASATVCWDPAILPRNVLLMRQGSMEDMKMDLGETWCGMDRIHLVQEMDKRRVVVTNLQIPQNVRKFLSS
jgi:hypothetical protein